MGERKNRAFITGITGQDGSYLTELLLEKGYDYRTIGKVLRVSMGTILSVKLSLYHGSKGYKKVITGIIREEKLIKLLETAMVKVLNLGTTGKGQGVWKYLKEEVKQKQNKNKKAF